MSKQIYSARVLAANFDGDLTDKQLCTLRARNKRKNTEISMMSLLKYAMTSLAICVVFPLLISN